MTSIVDRDAGAWPLTKVHFVGVWPDRVVVDYETNYGRVRKGALYDDCPDKVKNIVSRVIGLWRDDCYPMPSNQPGHLVLEIIHC